MKKLLIICLMVFTAGFYSCEVEPIDQESLNSVSFTSEECVAAPPDLPATLEACTTAKGLDANGTYFDLDITSAPLAGSYGAWCVDVDLSLDAPECFEADVYSSYDPALPGGVVENPENLDLVNWILNQDFPSQGYSMGDIQWAIWELIDDQNCASCTFLGTSGVDWDPAKGQEIVDAALANGDGFEPVAGQSLFIVLVPNNSRQPIIIPITLECEPEPECETAFARGNDGNTCFLDEGFSRWGWSIGPLSDGANESYEIYAGAGQCDISKGELVGTVDVSYIGGEVSVTYNIDPAYDVTETHTYAGVGMFPTDKKGKATVAPGKYEIQEGLSGEDIYVIAHAVVCQ